MILRIPVVFFLFKRLVQVLISSAQAAHLLRDRVDDVDLVERAVDALAADTHDARRNTDGRCVVRHLVEHDGARRNARVVAHAERAEHLRARADQHVVAERRVALAVVLAGAAERDALVQCAVVADLGRLADHDAHAVVDEQILPDFRAGMNLDARTPARALGDHARDKLHIVAVKPVRPAVGAHRLEAGVEEVHLSPAACGGVALHHGVQLRFSFENNRSSP